MEQYGAAWSRFASRRLVSLSRSGMRGEQMVNKQKQSEDEMRQDARLNKSERAAPAVGGGEATLPPEAQGLIGHQLRQEYRRLLSEPLPDKFSKLLEELAKSENKSESNE